MFEASSCGGWNDAGLHPRQSAVGCMLSMNPATRSSLVLFAFVVSGFGVATLWVTREAMRVKRERDARIRQSRPETGDMVVIGGGKFTMGSIDGNDDERPIHDVRVREFWMDRTEVTNEQFARFVAETNYVTDAEKRVPNGRAAGAFVFAPPAEIIDPQNELQWWKFVPGANWRHPKGPASTIEGLEKFPVVLVTFGDAQAYAKWANKRLPTEAEWEYAARGGLDRQRYPWGNELLPTAQWRMNVWQGHFPGTDLGEDGFRGLAPVASYSANSYGLYDMSGNVAEWCADWYLPDYYKETSKGKDSRDNPPGPNRSYDPAEPGVWKRVTRGGSWLTSPSVSTADWVSNRGRLAPDVPLANVGFRCVRDAARGN
jgi:formylglycine-generating enzyme